MEQNISFPLLQASQPMQPCHQHEEKDHVTINMRMFKCIDHNYPLKRWEMLYIHKIHQIKLIIIANYEWGIIN